MKRYKHNFNEGEIVADTRYKEVFAFSDRVDGLRAEKGGLRLASEEEKKRLTESGKDTIEI